MCCRESPGSRNTVVEHMDQSCQLPPWSGENQKKWQHVIPPLIIQDMVDLDGTKHHPEGGTDPEGRP